jgi:hypothetical protein
MSAAVSAYRLSALCKLDVPADSLVSIGPQFAPFSIALASAHSYILRNITYGADLVDFDANVSGDASHSELPRTIVTSQAARQEDWRDCKSGRCICPGVVRHLPHCHDIANTGFMVFQIYLESTNR